MTGPVLAIDGGGSKTLIAIADASGEVVRMAAGDGTNPMDNPRWRENLETLVTAFDIGQGPPPAAAVAALPSHGEVAAVAQVQREAVAALLGAVPHRVINDVDAAHLGAFAGGPGILILAGTGSMAWARDAAGKSYRVGGWGEGFGDEGSAYWIGLRAVTLASRDLDGRAPAPGLVGGLFDFLRLDRSAPQDSLGGWFAGLPHRRSGVAALAPLVDRLARAGDPAARAIIDAAAAHLAQHVTAIAHRLGTGTSGWSYAGGAFGSRLLRDAVAGWLDTPPQPPRLPPIGGALLAAATDLGHAVDDAWVGRLAAALARTMPALHNRRLDNQRLQRGEQGYA